MINAFQILHDSDLNNLYLDKKNNLKKIELNNKIFYIKILNILWKNEIMKNDE